MSEIVTTVVSCGRCCLMVCGYIVAVEGTDCPDDDVGHRPWIPHDFKMIEDKANAKLSDAEKRVEDLELLVRENSLRAGEEGKS
jgi:hypothetical protein